MKRNFKFDSVILITLLKETEKDGGLRRCYSALIDEIMSKFSCVDSYEFLRYRIDREL